MTKPSILAEGSQKKQLLKPKPLILAEESQKNPTKPKEACSKVCNCPKKPKKQPDEIHRIRCLVGRNGSQGKGKGIQGERKGARETEPGSQGEGKVR